MFFKKEMAYKELIIRMVVISLVLSIASGIAASFYLKNRAVSEMAKNDAKKTSELFFKGFTLPWPRDGIKTICKAL